MAGRGIHKKTLTQDERLNELKTRVHLCALRALLSKEEKAISLHDLESNRGRQKKAVRDLTKAQHIYFIGHIKKANSYSSDSSCYYWTGTLDSCVDEYAALDVTQGEDSVRRDLAAVLSGNSSAQNLSWGNIGWTRIQIGNLQRLAHAWTHRDDYLFMGSSKKRDTYSYDYTPDNKPRPWKECDNPQYLISRRIFASMPKLLLRNAAEIYTSVMYDYLMCLDAGLKGWSND